MDASPGRELVAPNHRFVFVAGLHRSGTSPLTACLRDHPQISGFHDTGVRQDEGLHLQDVYSSERRVSEPGGFGFDRASYLDESSALVTDENRRRLFQQWARHWDLDRPLLLEKSPPNLIRMRFLQALFPNSWFIAILRHPLVVASATLKWNRVSVDSLVRHWIVCHERFEADRPHLKNLIVVKYERFVRDPKAELGRIWAFLDVEPQAPKRTIEADLDQRYLERWRNRRRARFGLYDAYLAARYERRVRRFGYSLRHPRLAARPMDAPGYEKPAVPW